MWGSKKKQIKTSEFYKGTNIFNTLFNSVFGKIKSTFSALFTEEDIKQYSLPKVIVIGNESTGKSSLLENITKCQLFPRDSKLCTKCPVHVKLTHGSSKYIVSLPDTTKTNTNKVIKIENKHDIYTIISDYMNKLPTDHISETEITIDITDNNIPTFEFYDLPGIRTYPAETAETTTKLCKKYLTDKNAIVLCVVPASTTRLTSCQSIALITEMGMEHNCILALTMSDRLQPENIEELLIKRIIQTSDELKGLNFAGYIAVVNRIHSDLCSLAENDDIENKWFYENILEHMPDEYKDYETKIKENITIANLVLKMDQLYNNFIHIDWKPRILQTISEKINRLTNDYEKLGSEQINSKEINCLLREFLQSYVNEFKSDKILNKITFETIFIEENKIKNDNSDIIDTQYGDEQYKKYKKIRNYINKYCKNLDKINLEILIAFIEIKYDGDIKYNLIRFETIKNQFILDIQKYFEILQKNIPLIIKTCDDTLLQHVVNDEVNDTLFYLNIIKQLYKYMVAYPLFNMAIEYKNDDYVESNSYKQKRVELLKNIDITKEHYRKIQDL